MRRPLHAAAALLPLAAIVTPLATAAPAAAANPPILVDSEAAAGPGSLAAAIALANATAGEDTIVFDSGLDHVDVAGPITISDAVFINGCVNDGNPNTTNWVPVHAGPTSLSGVTFNVTAPDVTIQGLPIIGGGRPFDITATGDRFLYRAGKFEATGNTLRVTGAEEFEIGAGYPAPCITDLGYAFDGVDFIAGTHGVELIDAIDPMFVRAELDRTMGPAIEVRGGSGAAIVSTFIDGPNDDGDGHAVPAVIFDDTGFEGEPAWFANGRIQHCSADCLVIRNGSNAQVGVESGYTDFHGGTAPGAAHVRVSGSTALITGSLFGGGTNGVIVDGGSDDVHIEGNEFVGAGQAGILLQGSPAPVDTIIRSNRIGMTARDLEDGFAIPLASWPNTFSGIEVRAAAGLTITENLLAGASDDVTVRPVPPATGLVITDNVFGFDPETGDPIPSLDPQDPPAPNIDGIDAVLAPGALIEGNRFGGYQQSSIALGSGGGAVVRDNTIGNEELSGGNVGVFVVSDDVLLQDNDITNATEGVHIGGTLIVGGDRATLVGNTITGNATGIVAAGSSARVLENAVSANGVGVLLSGNANLVRGTTITGTLAPNAGVVVTGQRNTLTRLAASGNAGHAIDLVGTANFGVLAPVLTRATANGQGVRVQGSVNGPRPKGTALIDVYASPSCAANDHEAAVWLGQITMASGSFDGTVAAAPAGHGQLTATWTDALGDTSELSACLAAPAPGGGIPGLPPSLP